MAILKNELDNNFTQIPNEIICSNLSDKAFRLLIYLYSKKNNWKVYQDYVAKELNTSRQTVNKYFRELKEKGFLEITQIRTNDGFDYEYKLIMSAMSSSVDSTISSVNNCGVNTSKCQGTFTHTNTNLNNTDFNNTNLSNNNVDLQNFIKLAIDYLNQKTNKRYTYDTKDTVKFLKALFKSKTDIEDIKKVIDLKCYEWTNTEYEKYLRPATLFGNKFGTYLEDANNGNYKVNQQEVANKILSDLKDVEW